MQKRVSTGQVWSMDLIIGVIVFLIAVGLLLFFSGNQAEKDTSRLRVESRLIADTLTSDQANSIIISGAVDETRLMTIVSQGANNYQQLKAELGLRDDFCVIMIDQEDNVVVIGDGSQNRIGFGSDSLNITLIDLDKTVECGGLYT